MISPIHPDRAPSNPQRTPKAVGLISGGLDSTVAAAVMKDLGVEIFGVYFSMPWGCCDKGQATQAADKLGIPLMVLQLDERYLDVVKKPKHGYGSALNPCTDCRIHMFTRARQYMESIGADFIFTGEVLGQRPMSQMRPRLKIIEQETGLTGRLLRPLCAQLLDETIPEQEGLIDRSKLLSITGRSRRPQRDLASHYGISDYPNPAGGCLLTDQNFARRMRDVFRHGYRNFRETISLKWGRHFRLSDRFKAALGRNEEENAALRSYAHPDDFIFELPSKKGPTLILKGIEPGEDIIATCAGLVLKFSPQKDDAGAQVEYWPVKDPTDIRCVTPRRLDDTAVEQIKI